MDKKQQARPAQEDLALRNGLLWVAGAIVLEILLFLVNRFAFNFAGTAQGVALAEGLRGALKVLRILGAVALVGGGAMAVARKKNRMWIVCVVGVVVALCAHVALKYHSTGMRMLYLLVPVLGGIALTWFIYPREFVLGALPTVAAALGLWFYRVGGVGVEFIVMLVAAVLMLVALVMLKKQDGMCKSIRILPEKSVYTMPVVSAAAAAVVQALAVVVGGTVAYYMIFLMGAWLFALLVYYTVKLL